MRRKTTRFIGCRLLQARRAERRRLKDYTHLYTKFAPQVKPANQKNLLWEISRAIRRLASHTSRRPQSHRNSTESESWRGSILVADTHSFRNAASRQIEVPLNDPPL